MNAPYNAIEALNKARRMMSLEDYVRGRRPIGCWIDDQGQFRVADDKLGAHRLQNEGESPKREQP